MCPVSFLDGIFGIGDRKRRNTDCFFSDYLCSQRVYGGNCNDCPGRCFVQMSDGFGKQQTFDGAYGRDYEDTNNGLVGSGTFYVSVFFVFMAFAVCGAGRGNPAALCREGRAFSAHGGYGNESFWAWNGA